MMNFKRLSIWKKSFDLSGEVYQVTNLFPKSEIYGLTSQLRRAAVSIFSNIAEGSGRRTSKDFISFLYNALGSVKEVEAQLLFAGKLKYVEDDEVNCLIDKLNELGKMLMGLIKHVSRLDVK